MIFKSSVIAALSAAVLSSCFSVSSAHEKATRRRDSSQNDCYSCGHKNPCDPLLTEGLLYYTRCDHPDKFVQCSDSGQCSYQKCPEGLIWDQRVLACVSAHENAAWTGDSIKAGQNDCYSCGHKNPCDPLLTEGLFYYARCDHPNKFVQCSDSGQCSYQKCPEGLIWNQTMLTCVAEVEES